MFLLIQTIDFGFLIIALLFAKKIFLMNVEYILFFFLLKSYVLMFPFFKFKNIINIVYLRVIMLILIFSYLIVFFKLNTDLTNIFSIIPLICNTLGIIIVVYSLREKLRKNFKLLMTSYIYILSYHVLVMLFIIYYSN